MVNSKHPQSRVEVVRDKIDIRRGAKFLNILVAFKFWWCTDVFKRYFGGDVETFTGRRFL